MWLTMNILHVQAAPRLAPISIFTYWHWNYYDFSQNPMQIIFMPFNSSRFGFNAFGSGSGVALLIGIIHRFWMRCSYDFDIFVYKLMIFFASTHRIELNLFDSLHLACASFLSDNLWMKWRLNEMSVYLWICGSVHTCMEMKTLRELRKMK